MCLGLSRRQFVHAGLALASVIQSGALWPARVLAEPTAAPPSFSAGAMTIMLRSPDAPPRNVNGRVVPAPSPESYAALLAETRRVFGGNGPSDHEQETGDGRH